MIVTVTCNPALDITYRVPALTRGSVHRVSEVSVRAGGKGVNVAAVLHQLGEEVTALGLGDADFGARVEALGPSAVFLDVAPAVRRTTVVHDDSATTSLWEPGVPVAEGAAAELLGIVDAHLAEADALVVSGSLPPGLEPGLPARLGRLAAAHGVPAVLDLDDAPLAEAVREGGAVLAPNQDELDRLLGGGGSGDLVADALALSHRTGAPTVLTLGAEGIVATDGETAWHARPVEPVSGNPTGAGDATAAGIARGLAADLGWPEILADAVALGSAAVRAPVAGEVDLDAWRSWRERVPVDEITTYRTGR